jgi:hypothetical protein
VKKGGASLDPPSGPAKDFEATFGAFVLCVQKPDVSVDLSRVTYPPDAPPGTTAFIRTVTPDLVANVPPDERPAYVPMAFGLGSPPTFNQAYAGLNPPGKYTNDLEGVPVLESCGDANDAIQTLNEKEVPATGYTELMIVIPAASKGAEVDGFHIEYVADGSEYVESVPWTMVVCDRAGARSHC